MDLFGNWSDHPDFVSRHRSVVVNSAILLSRTGVPVRVVLVPLDKPVVVYRSIDRCIERCLAFDDIRYRAVSNVLLERYPSASAEEFHDQLRHKGGLLFETHAAVPFASGLGTSSSLTVCALLAVWHLEGRSEGASGVALRAYELERAVSGCGWQDHSRRRAGAAAAEGREIAADQDLPVQLHRHGDDSDYPRRD